MTAVNDDFSFVEIRDEIGISTLCTLAETIWYEFFPSIISMSQIEYMLKKFLSAEAIAQDLKSGFRYFLCKDGREYVGFIAVQPKTEMSSGGGRRRLFLSKLYLVQENRGIHLCSKMIRKVQQEARDAGCEDIFLTVNKYNSHAIDVYYHYGFRKDKSIEMDIGGGFIMDDYVMSCPVEDLKV